MISQVIWRDTYYTTTADTQQYYLQVNGENIFYGKAYKAPDDDRLRINISKICQDYLDCEMPVSTLTTSAMTLTHENAFKVFKMYNENNYPIETYRFLYGWNYDNYDEVPDPAENVIVLSNPVNGHFSGNQWRPYTTYGNSGSTRENTGWVKTETYGSDDYVTEIPCGKWAVIYLNARGGWDSFLFEGTENRTDEVNQHILNKSFNNNTSEYETDRYISEINTYHELNTGWLTDEEAKNFAWNFLNSNKVYLHNLITDEIKPAILTDNNVKYQTYQTNGKRLAQYKVKIKESQQKVRK